MHRVVYYNVEELFTSQYRLTSLSLSAIEVGACPLALWLHTVSIWLGYLLWTTYHLNLSLLHLPLLMNVHCIRLVSPVLNYGRVPCPHAIAFVALIQVCHTYCLFVIIVEKMYLLTLKFH